MDLTSRSSLSRPHGAGHRQSVIPPAQG
jgi:hypothetical protein